jgi:GxxExxY protein
MALRHKELTGRILKAYYEVWNHTARVYPEYLYESCLLRELGRNVPCVRQDEYEIRYKDFKVGSQRLDMFVAGEVVVELKVAPELTKLHKAQAISYIKVVQKHDGLLLNFGGDEPTFTRLFYDEPELAMHPDTIHKVRESPEHYAPDLVHKIQGALYEVFSHLGPGFIYRIYGNACYRELTQRGLNPIARNNLEVIYKGQPDWRCSPECRCVRRFPWFCSSGREAGLRH